MATPVAIFSRPPAVPSYGSSVQRAMTLKSLAGQQELQGMQLDQARREQQLQAEMEQLAPQFLKPAEDGSMSFDMPGFRNALYSKGYWRQGQAIDSAIANTAKQKLDLANAYAKMDEASRAKAKDRIAMIGQLAMSADTPEKWDAGIRQLASEGLDFSQYLGKFSPETRAQAISMAMSTKDTLDRLDKQANALVNVDPVTGKRAVNPTALSAKAAVAAAGRPQTTIQMPFESSYAKTAGTEVAKTDIETVKTAENAPAQIQKLDDVIRHIQTSDAITGPGAEIFKNIEQAKQLFLADKESGRKVSDTQVLESMLGSDVFSFIKSLGIGARGLDTPAEREFMLKVMTGTISLNKDALVKITKLRRDMAKRAIDRYNSKVESGSLDTYFRATGRPKQKIEIPAEPSPEVGGQGEAPPIYAVNPQTGERIMSIDGGATWKQAPKQ